MSNKILGARLKTLISEYKVMDVHIQEVAKKVMESKGLVEGFVKEDKPYEEIKEQLLDIQKSSMNFSLLQNDIFGSASKVVEANNIVKLLGVEIDFTEEEEEIIKACNYFTEPVFRVLEGKVETSETEYRKIVEEMTGKVNGQDFLRNQYESFLKGKL